MATFEELTRSLEAPKMSRKTRHQLAARSIAHAQNTFDIVKMSALNEQFQQYASVESAGHSGVSIFSEGFNDTVVPSEQIVEENEQNFGTGALREYSTIELAELRLDAQKQAVMAQYGISEFAMRRVVSLARKVDLS